MSPQESGPGEPKRDGPGNGHDDERSAPAGAGGPDKTSPVPPGLEQPWAPPGQLPGAAQEANPGHQANPGQKDGHGQHAPWGQQPGWQQQADPRPPQWQQPSERYPSGQAPYGTPPYGYNPYGHTPHHGGPYPGASPYGDQAYNGQAYGGQAYAYPNPLPYGVPPTGQPHYVAPPKPGIIPLRPLMFGEILDGSFQAIRRNARAMLGAGLLAQSLSAILAAVLTGFIATSFGSMEAWAQTASNAEASSLGTGLMAGFALFSILSVFLSAVLQGAMVVPVARSVLNRPTGFRSMLSLTRPRIGALVRLAALLVAAALAAIMLFFALIVLLFSNVRGAAALLVIPLMMGFGAVFLWVAVKLMVAPAAVVIEELGAFAGLRRSWDLTRANWWRILGVTLVVAILVGVITQVVLIPASLLPTVMSGVISPHGGRGQDASMAVAMGIITAVIGALVGAVGYAFQTSVMALLYMDLRMRKDGLDIALLRQLENGSDPDGIPGRGAQAGSSSPYPGYGTAPGAWPYGR